MAKRKSGSCKNAFFPHFVLVAPTLSRTQKSVLGTFLAIMVSVVLVAALLLSLVSGFQLQANKFRISLKANSLKATMSSSEPDPIKPQGLLLVPLEKKNIEQSAAVTGGILGLVLGGPFGAAMFAAISNYLVKQDNEPGEALRGVGKTVIESYNFLNKLNSKYSIAGKVKETVSNAFESIDREKDNEVVQKVKTTYASATEKIVTLNEEFNLVGKSKQVLDAAAKLSDAAIEKTVELDSKV